MPKKDVTKRIDLKVGFSCNNHCRFCVQGDKRSYIQQIPYPNLIRLLQKSILEFDSVVITGGEPCLYPQLTDLVFQAKQIGFRQIQIQTNGRMFAYNTFCRQMISAGATEFSPAVHGHIKQLHDYLTNSIDSFDQTMTGIRNLKQLDQKVITNTVITRSNFRHLAQIVQNLARERVDQIQLAFVHPVGNASVLNDFESIVPRFSSLKPYLQNAIEEGRKYNVFVNTEAIPPCFMIGYDQHIGEYFIPETKIFDADNIIESYNDYRKTMGKQKGPNCIKCLLFQRCEGIWKEYGIRYGFEEMIPVIEQPNEQENGSDCLHSTH